MNSLRLLAFLPVALAILGNPVEAAAQPPPEALPWQSQAERDANAAFAEGRAAYARGDLEGARRSFLRAYQLYPTYRGARNLAAVEKQLGLLTDAAKHLEDAAARAPKDMSADERKALDDELASVRAGLAEVRVHCLVDGVDVRIGDAIQGRCDREKPLRALLVPGRYGIEARRPGYKDAHLRLDFFKGTSQDLDLDLVPVAGPGPEEPDAADSDDDGLPIGWLAAPIAVAAIGASAGLGLHVRERTLGDEADALRATLIARSGPNSCATPVNADVADCAALVDAVDGQRAHRDGATAMLAVGTVGAAAAAVMVLVAGASDEDGPYDVRWLLLPAGVATVSLAASLGLHLRASELDDESVSQLADIEQRSGAAPCENPAPADVDACATLSDTVRDHATAADASTAMAAVGLVGVAATAGLFAYYAAAPRSEAADEPPRALVVPAIGADYQGLVVSGSF